VIPGVIGTKGGLKTDERARVLNVWGEGNPRAVRLRKHSRFLAGTGPSRSGCKPRARDGLRLHCRRQGGQDL